MSIDVPGHDPIMLDLGTGARYFGLGWPPDQPFHATCLVSHLHWDHIQGLPFFPPLLRAGSRLDLHAPVQEDGLSLQEVVESTLRHPLFPVGLDAFPGEITFHTHADEEFAIGEVRVISRLIPHIGNTLGYRIEWGGASVAYLSDHQQPGVDVYAATENAKQLCRGVDVLIHDAQYTKAEFVQKASWGHCTVDYALWLAAECDAGMLVLFHHDPMHNDDGIDAIVAELNGRHCSRRVNVIGAREGLTLCVGR